MQCKQPPDTPGAPDGPDEFRAPGRRTLSPNALFFFADVSLSLQYLVSLDTALWYRATSIVTLSIPAISPRGGYIGRAIFEITETSQEGL